MRDLDRVLRAPPSDGGGIGCVGPDLPVELLAGSGLWHGYLPWGTAAATPFADRWLETAFPGWARRILEQWHEGRFDGLSRVLFSRADDASQRLYYYTRELRRLGKLAGPRPMIFDIALQPRDSSLGHTEAAVAELAADLDVQPERLAQGITRTNVLRGQLAEAQSRRAAATNAPRVLLAGSVPPDGRLHEAIEAAGAGVVAEAHVFGRNWLGTPLEPGSAASLRALAQHLRTHSVAPRSVIDRARWIVDEARAARADAVVLWLTREEESLAWHVPAQRRALQEANVPALVLTARNWLADDGALGEITGFCRGVRP